MEVGGEEGLEELLDGLRRRQDQVLQRVIREEEERRVRVHMEGEKRLEKLYREQEEEVVRLVEGWQGRGGRQGRGEAEGHYMEASGGEEEEE